MLGVVRFDLRSDVVAGVAPLHSSQRDRVPPIVASQVRMIGIPPKPAAIAIYMPASISRRVGHRKGIAAPDHTRQESAGPGVPHEP